MTTTVALASAPEFFHLDEDLPAITEALVDLGAKVVTADWHDPTFDWSAAELTVVRSTWDYTWQLHDFLAWGDRVSNATTLRNPVEVLRWNTDKRYLPQLAAAGVPVVPTTVVEPKADTTPGTELGIAWPDAAEVVVKPTVSAGGRDTERYPSSRLGDASAHARSLLDAGRAVLVQPYLPAIDEQGETGLVYAGDRFSHAFGKGPILVPGSTFVEGQYREESITARAATDAELEVAEAALDAVGDCLTERSRADLLYARVDLAPTPSGPVVMELELVEPSLYCSFAPGAAERVARAIHEAALATS